MPRLKLTAAALKAARAGDVLKCPEVRGLELRCKGRVMSWQYYYRAPDGTQRRPKLGEYPTLSLDAARTAARAMAARVAAGNDPSRQRAELQAAARMSDLCARYLAEWASRKKRSRSADEDRRNIRLHVIPAMGNKRVAEISQADIEHLIARLAERGPYLANAVRALLSKMFNLAESAAWSMRPPNSNPVRGTTRQTTRARRRKASADEMRAVCAALAGLQMEYPAHVAAIMIFLYAGTRVSELLGTEWTEYYGDRIVRHEHKTMRTGEDRVIYLPSQARKLIETLPRRGELVFGGIDRFATFRVWERARDAAKAVVPSTADLRQQDLRRTFASIAKSSGVGLDTVGELFGHRSQQTTAGYAYLYDDAATGAVQSVADKIDADLLHPRRKP